MRNKFFRAFCMAPDGAAGGGTGDGANQQETGNQQAAPPQIDYEKIAQLVAGKQAVTEDSVLKGYFRQQGLSKEEMDQAIAAFKQQKAAQTPDVNAMQTQLAQAQAEAQQAKVESVATMEAVRLGIEAGTVPYILKMADLSQAVGQDGKVNAEALKAALGKVLEDVPALKPQAAGSSGFIQVGAGGPQQTSTSDDALKKAFGL